MDTHSACFRGKSVYFLKQDETKEPLRDMKDHLGRKMAKFVAWQFDGKGNKLSKNLIKKLKI